MNIINILIFSERFEIDDEDYKTALKIGNGILECYKNGDPTAILPWLRYFPLSSFKCANETLLLRRNFVSKRVLQHESTIDANKIRDITDSLIASMKDKDELKKHELEGMDYDDIESVLSDIFNAGFETTLTTLGWAVLYLIHWPKYQEEIYTEMIECLSQNRKPTINDRSSLNLMEAFIQETLRMSSAVHCGIPHKTMENTSVAGKNIPKDTTVIFNFWNIAHDERYWENPMDFNPRRWLDEEGRYNQFKHKSIPFSAGKRMCFGEPLARKELFLYLSRILYEFEIQPNPDEPFPSLEADCKLVLFHLPYTAIFKRRNHQSP